MSLDGYSGVWLKHLRSTLGGGHGAEEGVAMSRRIVVISLSVVLLFLGIFLSVPLSRSVNTWRAEREAVDWGNKATAESTPEFSFDDAFDWLDRNEFEVTDWEPKDRMGWLSHIASEHTKSVWGYKVHSPGGTLFTKQCSVLVQFIFSEEGRLLSIQSQLTSPSLYGPGSEPRPNTVVCPKLLDIVIIPFCTRDLWFTSAYAAGASFKNVSLDGWADK